MSLSTGLAKNPIRIYGQKKTTRTLVGPITKKLLEAVEYGSLASIYSPEITATELTTAQTVVLSLFYGLLFGDVSFCRSILQLEVDQLRSTYLRLWLVDDFHFSKHDVAMVLSMMSYLLETGKLPIPEYVIRIYGGLVDRYSVADCCSESLLAAFGPERWLATQEHMAANGDISSRDCDEGLIYLSSDTDTRNDECEKYSVAINDFKTLFNPVGKVNFRWLYEKSEDGHRLKSEDIREAEFQTINKQDVKLNGNEGTVNHFPLDPDRNGDNALDEDTVISVHPVVAVKGEVNGNSSKNKLSEASYQDQRQFSTDSTVETKVIDHKKFTGSESVPRHFETVDGEGRTLLHRLAQFGRTEAVHRLLDEGVDLDSIDHYGKTALHWAAQYNHWETVSLLLERGAQVNARAKDGRTPLSFASFKGGSVSRAWVIVSEHGGTM